MIEIQLFQEVMSNTDYIVCEGGIFSPFSYVFCKRKDEESFNTCTFLASQIANENVE